MLKFPYGIADFQAIIRDGYVYVDRTSYFHDLEDLGRHLLFVRPRRFGKSLWLQTLASYYDLRTADAHEEFFGGLDAGRNPTPNAHRYFVLQWDFSLTYFGMLTIDGVSDRALSLKPPNLVVRKLYVDQVLRFLLPDGMDRSVAWDHERHGQSLRLRAYAVVALGFERLLVQELD